MFVGLATFLNVAEPVFVPFAPVAVQVIVTDSPSFMPSPIVTVVLPLRFVSAPLPILYDADVQLALAFSVTS